MIKTNFAFSKLNKEHLMLDYYFYLEAYYKMICKKCYFSKDVISKLYKFANKSQSLFHRSVSDDRLCLLYGIHHDITEYHHTPSQEFRNNIINMLFKSKVVNDNEYTLMSGVDIIYNDLADNFFKKDPSFNMFTVFKSKDKTDQNYYMCIGASELTKCLTASKYSWAGIGATIDRAERIIKRHKQYKDMKNVNWPTKEEKEIKFMPIGNYFIFVKFQPNKGFKREAIRGEHMNLGNIFPTRINSIKYLLNEEEINKQFEPTEINFELY